MKTMQNFAAQQLSKKQMNEVKGGQSFLCMCKSGDKPLTTTPETKAVFVVKDDFSAAVFLTQISCPNGGTCQGLG